MPKAEGHRRLDHFYFVYFITLVQNTFTGMTQSGKI